jgi:hypothetical protein
MWGKIDMVAAFVCTMALDTKRVANEEAARAAETPFELFEGVGPSWRFWFWLWILNVTRITALWKHFILALLFTVGELIPEATWTPKGVKSAIFVVHGGNLWILVCVLFRFIIVTRAAVSFASKQRCDEIIRVTSGAL